jgi:hypothetical protein
MPITRSPRWCEHLVAVERALVLADDNGVEAPIRIGQHLQQRGRLWPVRPRQAPAAIGVEELDHNPAMTSDQVLGHVVLPAA